jgi:hypothetical protein
MWWIAKRRKCRDATQFVVDASRLAFARYLPDGRLARAMHADPYVLGYVVARLHGMAQRACEAAGIAAEVPQIVDAAGKILFGACYRALRDTMLCAALLPEDGAYGEGLRDGRTQCDYLFGARDVTQHPRYRDAAAGTPERMDASVPAWFAGSAAQVAQHLEVFTFGRYFEHRY